MNDRRSGAILSYIYSITQVVVNLLYVPILLSRIGQTEYGLYQMIGSLIAYLSIIYSIFSGGAVRFYSKYYVLNDEEGMANTLGMLKRLYRIAYPLILFASVVAAGIYIAVYQDTLSSWEIRESCIMIGMLALNLMLSLENTIPTACITAHEKFTFLKLSSILLLIAQPIAIVFLIQWFPFAVTITAVQLTCNFLIVLVQNWYSKYRLGMDTRIRFLDKRLEKQVLTFSGAIVLGSVADQIFWKSDQLILAYFYGADTVAVYAVGSQIVNTYAPLGTAVSSVFMPKIEASVVCVTRG
jgi:O-antigen/teichoic acid export membrane protein